MQERKKKRLFKLQSSLGWRQLNRTKEEIKGEFTYVQCLYMHEGVASMVEILKHLVIQELILKMLIREQRRWLMGKQLI